MKVSICVPYKDKPDIIKNTLDSIYKNTPTDLFKLYILDNGSKTKISGEKENLKIINSPENLGFGRGLNLLISLALKDDPNTHILVLNDDVELKPNWLDNLLKCLEKNPKAGVIGSVCFYPNGQIQHAGAYINNNYTGQHFQEIPKEAKEFEYIPFVCVLLNNNLVIDLIANQGLVFDEGIKKAYSEDVDVCYSARKYGYTCLLEPTSQIIHYEGTSQKMGILGSADEVRKLQFLNKEYVAKKWEDVDYTDKDKKYQVCFVARVAGQLSYQQVLKNIAPRLDKESQFDVSILPEETVYSPEHLPRDWELRKLRLKPFDENRICVRYTEGEYAYLAYSRDIIYSTLENWGNHIPYNWKTNINKFKQCWVTSNAVKETYQRCGITIPIKVIPHGIDFEIWDYKKEPYYNPHLPKFLFFINDMYGDRKNMDSSVAAFIRVFKGNKDVGLYIQSSNLHQQLAQKGYTKGIQGLVDGDMLKKKIHNNWLCSLGWDGNNQIYINENWIDTETLVSLYARASAVISIGNEGFGLCGLQAMAMKKPLIYLNIGGMLDFASKETAFPVEVGELVPSRQLWLQSQYINGVWATADYDSLQSQLLEVYNGRPLNGNRDGYNTERVEKGYEFVKENFTWEKTINKITEAIKEL